MNVSRRPFSRIDIVLADTDEDGTVEVEVDEEDSSPLRRPCFFFRVLGDTAAGAARGRGLELGEDGSGEGWGKVAAVVGRGKAMVGGSRWDRKEQSWPLVLGSVGGKHYRDSG